MEYLKQSIDTIEADGGNYAIDGSIKVVWDSTSNMDEMNLTGFYYITGTRTNTNDNLPVSNTGNIVAWLRVANLDATNSFISQILDFGNVGGKDATTYVRTYNGSKWSSWQKMQTMNEVGVVASLDSYIDNGMYSGVLQSNYEMFVLITINNYAVSSTAGITRSVAQFKYSLSIEGNVTYSTRTGHGADTIFWSEWSDIAQKKVSEEAALRAQADNNLQTQIDSLNEFLNSDFLEQTYAYGIEWDTTITAPECTRIGSMNLHRSLPVQSGMRGCLLNDNGVVVEYLPADDWTSAVRDGSRGQVMVEIPKHYRKFVTDGTKRQVWLSMMPLAGYHEVPKAYVGAYEAALDRTNKMLASVVNASEQYRGGKGTAAWDGTYRSLLGKPVTGNPSTDNGSIRFPVGQHLECARKRNSNTTEWNSMTYEIYKEIVWLFVVEYATRNSQATLTTQLTSEGFKQGGLGVGATTVDNTIWNTYNERTALLDCGVTDSIGNGTGEVDIQMPTELNSIILKANRYRGIENPFGHIACCLEGVLLFFETPTADYGDVYLCSTPQFFAKDARDASALTNYTKIGQIPNTKGYDWVIKDIMFGDGGELLTIANGGSSSQNFCDLYGAMSPAGSPSALRYVIVGGYANSNAWAGFFYNGNSYNGYYLADSRMGTRLCFIPEKQ